MGIRTLGQMRAEHAWNMVDDSKARLGPVFDKDFADAAKKMPMRIRASGLGQTLAFLRAKNQAQAVMEAMTGWCKQRGIGAGGEAGLLDVFRKGDAAELRRATAECLSYLEWLVRFADARREKKSGGTQ